MNKRIVECLVAVLFGAGAMCAQATTIAVDMVPGGAVDPLLMVAPGTSFDLNVVVENAADLAGFQFDLGFDLAVLDATSVTSGGFFGAATFDLVNAIVGNTVSFGETTVDPGITGAGPSVLVTIHFNVIGEGASALSLSNLILSDSAGDPINADQLDGTLVSRKPVLGVSAPEPALLVLFGVLALFATRKAGAPTA